MDEGLRQDRRAEFEGTDQSRDISGEPTRAVASHDRADPAQRDSGRGRPAGIPLRRGFAIPNSQHPLSDR